MQKEQFINRKSELVFLEEIYKKAYSAAQFLVLYGKRRVGKTELIKHFIKDKPAIYYLASKGAAKEQLGDISVITGRFFNDAFIDAGTFTSWRQYFDYLGTKLSQTSAPLILVVDEFPYLAHSNKAIPSYFQYGWDEVLKNHKVVLVLMGSSIAMMQKHTLAHKSPLYGRRTSQWLLEPFTFNEAKNFYPEATFTKVLEFYALLGGIPAYLKEFDPTQTLEENIVQKILKKGAFLNIEPELLISDEFDEPKNYLSLLRSIGVGATKFADILNHTGLQSGQATSYLKRLVDLKIVRREVPVTEKIPAKSKMGLYTINDNFMRFYFSCMYPYQNFVETENFYAFLTSTRDTIAKIISKSYEDLAVEITQDLMLQGILPNFERLGRWWDNQTEIDLVGLSQKTNTILFAEVKYQTKPLNYGHYVDLVAKSKKVNWESGRRKDVYMLMSKSGFEPDAKEKLLKEGVILVQEDSLITPQSFGSKAKPVIP